MIEVFNTDGFDGLDFETPKLAQVNLIVGPNGVGKTRLLSAIWNSAPERVESPDRYDRQWQHEQVRIRNVGAADMQMLFAPYLELYSKLMKHEYITRCGDYYILGILLAMSEARGKTLLLDQIENGLHYTAFDLLWKHLFYLAKLWKGQIIATTHSRDCIHGFAEQALEDADMALLFRMGHSVRTSDKDKVIATTYRGDEFRYLSYCAGYIECR